MEHSSSARGRRPRHPPRLCQRPCRFLEMCLLGAREWRLPSPPIQKEQLDCVPKAHSNSSPAPRPASSHLGSLFFSKDEKAKNHLGAPEVEPCWAEAGRDLLVCWGNWEKQEKPSSYVAAERKMVRFVSDREYLQMEEGSVRSFPNAAGCSSSPPT